jgi:hypothetical protein
MPEKERGVERGEREREREREIVGIPGSQRCCFPFLLEPRLSRIGLLPPLRQAICKNS